jgi:hypothetical protein
LWLASIGGASQTPAARPAGSEAADPEVPTPAESLRLIHAFARIQNPSIRRRLVSIAEKCARNADRRKPAPRGGWRK